MKIATSVVDLIGHTPLVRLSAIERAYGLQATLLAKLEGANPAGSAKDRVALAMIRQAQADGRLQEDSVIIEPTSGNTGIGLCAIGARLGYRTVIVMPDTMSVERCRLMRAYGAEVVLSEGALGMAGAIARAEEMARQIPHAFIPSQFDNPANPEAHYRTTGPEIYADTEGNVDMFIAGVGTGGTISGVGRYLKEKRADVCVVGVEPRTSAVLSGGCAGAHGIQGIGAGFVPNNYDAAVVDRVVTVDTEQAYAAGRALATKEGILAGISSGAALAAAIVLCADVSYQGKTVVVLLADTGERYLSTPMFSEESCHA